MPAVPQDQTRAGAGPQAPATEPAPPGRSTLAVLLLGWAAGIMSTGVCLAAVSLVPAAADLGLSPWMRSAAASASSLAIAATAVAAGVAADRLGRRRVLMWSYLLATAGCLLVVVAPSGAVYLLGSVVAGVAYGLLLSASYAYVKVVAPPEGLGRALGLWGMSSILVGTAAGLAGGLLAGVDWRLLFLVVPAMCLPGALLTPRLLPRVPRVAPGRLDLWGIVLIGLGLVVVIAGVLAVAADPGGAVGWALVIGGGLVLAAWALVELRRPAPAFPVRLFGARTFAAAVLVGIFVNAAYAIPVISLSDYLQYEQQGSVLAATLGLQPFYLIGAAAWFFAGRSLSAGRAPRGVIALNCLVAAIGFLLLLPLGQDAAYWLILPGSLLIGYGVNAALTGQAQVIVDAAPPEAYGAVTSSRLTVGELGYSIGMIFTTLILSRVTANGIIRGLTASGLSEHEAYDTLASLNASLVSGRPPEVEDLPDVLGVVASAFDTAFNVRMVIGAAVMVLVAAATLLLMPRPGHGRRG